MRLGTLVFSCALPKGMASPLRKCRSTAIGCSFPGRTATQSAVMECYYQLLRRYRDSICMVDDIVWKESAWTGAGISSVIKDSGYQWTNSELLNQNSLTFCDCDSSTESDENSSIEICWFCRKKLVSGTWHITCSNRWKSRASGTRGAPGLTNSPWRHMAAFFGCPDSWLTSVFKWV